MNYKILIIHLIFGAGFCSLLFCADSSFVDIDLVAMAKNGDSFIIGEGVQSIAAARTVAPFFINKYETTYALWYKIRVRAESEFGYIFQNPGQEGAAGRRGKPPTAEHQFQPVTAINWRDALVWCNALSECEGRTPCYTYEAKVLRDASDAASVDLAECDWKSNGYRLPTEAEWEYAARKIPNKSGTSSFKPANTLSGPGWNFENIRSFNRRQGTANVATAGSLLGPDSEPLSGFANPAGIYDMSGNALEFCWDWFDGYKATLKNQGSAGPQYGAERTARGGSWSPYAPLLYSGDRYAYDPSEAYNYMGLRFCTISKP